VVKFFYGTPFAFLCSLKTRHSQIHSRSARPVRKARRCFTRFHKSKKSPAGEIFYFCGHRS